jgi:hypothetical protein
MIIVALALRQLERFSVCCPMPSPTGVHPPAKSPTSMNGAAAA